jgi:hypothetical protein
MAPNGCRPRTRTPLTGDARVRLICHTGVVSPLGAPVHVGEAAPSRW